MSYFNYNQNLKHLLKHQFKNLELVDTNYSQMQQDMFVLSVLDGKTNGIYVEIGAHHPVAVNNTFLLENKFDWKGISFELDVALVAEFNMQRKNTCIAGDATKMDYQAIFDRYKIPKDFDYLSVDIEPPDNTFLALKMVLDTGAKPTVITFEHEAMSGTLGQEVREISRLYLQKQGYTLMVKDISNLGVGSHDLGVPYNVEDWWVLRNRIDDEIWNKLEASTVDFIESRNTVYNL